MRGCLKLGALLSIFAMVGIGCGVGADLAAEEDFETTSAAHSLDAESGEALDDATGAPLSFDEQTRAGIPMPSRICEARYDRCVAHCGPPVDDISRACRGECNIAKYGCLTGNDL